MCNTATQKEQEMTIGTWRLRALIGVSGITGACAGMQLMFYYDLHPIISITVGGVIAMLQFRFFLGMWFHFRKEGD